jgi:D-alanine-D-alanine ligase
MANNKKLKILVLSGGPSTEREVSIKSGKNVYTNLDRNKYMVSSLLMPKSLDSFFTDKNKKILKKSDLIFIAMHGYFGEDGKLQSYLESLEIKYTGSNAFSSSLSMNKYFSTKIVESAGFCVPKTYLISRGMLDHEILNLTKKIKFPLFLKPNNGGSSDGACIVKNGDDFKKNLNPIFKTDNEAVLQEIVIGRELTCGVLGNVGSKIEALPPVEIPKQGQFFDKKIKYSKDTVEICPAELTPKEASKIKDISKRIHELLQCRGVSRSDFILAGNKFYYLETNSIPGMTESSLILKEAKAVGMTFPDLLDRIVELALK